MPGPPLMLRAYPQLIPDTILRPHQLCIGLMPNLIRIIYDLRPAIGIHLAGNPVGDIELIINLFRCCRAAI